MMISLRSIQASTLIPLKLAFLLGGILPEGFIKLNADDSFLEDRARSGAGGII